ncbi:protein ENDOSPERM DEFECTIVE 1 [Ziziphus jujuba]|uniref:Protein ENDOSPERM DEFECTIVE 1 n=2 Tax=Ziziphus jujuba TaxID=326968 RepID=A0A6P4BEB9_ZIZJJ|nr:protein ENDOSPERM DEFECTIVE 1 [Ziziphus jujuba]XP_048325295.1 protein ENDOSPERM DEFECTIVE 1 [Ziziphus jujuba]KAH7546975.1 hypothetical protein FEM48_Zijuj01G0258100 [Ziziphus jujuba var. spinosa]
MGELVVEVCASPTAVDAGSAPSSTSISAPPPPPPPPTQHRRPRVREVSSRFMSPLISSSSSSSDLPHLLPSKSPIPKQHHTVSVQSPNLLENQSRQQQRSTSLQRRRRQLDMENLPSSDENSRPSGTDHPPLPIQSSETPFHLEQIQSTLTLRKQRSAKLLKENGVGRQQTHQQNSLKTTCPGRGGANNFATPSRPDTPMVTASMDRTTMTSSSSRFRLMQQRTSTNMTNSAAAKLLQSSVTSLPSQPTTSNHPTSSTTQDDGPQENQVSDLVGCTSRSLSDFRTSSMPEANMVIVVPSRYRSDKTLNRAGGNGNATCSRSLNLPSSSPSSSDTSPFQSIDGSEKLTSAVMKQQANSAKMGGICLPPVPPCAGAKMGTDTRKAKKVSSHQEDVHSLRLFHNRYIQWRYANARAQVSMQAQQRETEKKLCSLGVKISELYDSVVRKRIELGILQRTKTLSAILEAQIPYLDKWSAFEGDYSISLAETVQALSNASLQIPISGNVKVDIKEVEEALNSAAKVMEMIVGHVQHYIPKGEEMENLITEVARIVGGEKAFIEECGDLLAKTYTSQVEECSLRGHLIQLHCRRSNE